MKIRRLLLCMLLVFTMGYMKTNVNALSTKTKACKAYVKLLANGYLWNDYDDYDYLKFKTVDINRDGVPELMVQDNGASHAEGTYGYYAYIGGKIKFLESYNDYSCVYKKRKTGYIYEKAAYMGMTVESWYAFNGKTLKSAYSKETNEEGSVTYYKDSSSISKATYDKAIKAIKKNATKVTFTSLHKNHRLNREKYIYRDSVSLKNTNIIVYNDSNADPNEMGAIKSISISGSRLIIKGSLEANSTDGKKSRLYASATRKLVLTSKTKYYMEDESTHKTTKTDFKKYYMDYPYYSIKVRKGKVTSVTAIMIA